MDINKSNSEIFTNEQPQLISPKSKRVALCFSGHLRDFHLCYNSLHDNFIKPLMDTGFQVDIFGFFWNVLGHRNTGWEGIPNFDFFKEKMAPKSLIIEAFNRMGFIQRFTTNQWMSRPTLSCLTTSGDATSMWYAIFRCFREIENYQSNQGFIYDVICRVRPDLIYDTPLDIKEIEDIMNRDVIYMPKWRGKYYEICHEMVDYFGMGNYKVMKQYLSTFLNIPKYLGSNEYIHTAEGFLLAQLEGYTIERTNIQFSVQRAGYIENVMC
jgi:hypothetical protein